MQKALKKEWEKLGGGSQADAADDAGSSADEAEPKRKKLKIKMGGGGGPKPDAASEDQKPPPPVPSTAPTASTVKDEPSVLKKDPSSASVPSGPTGGPPTVKQYLRSRLHLLEEVKENDKAHGRKLITVFEDLPDRIEWKQYYDVITNPMSFGMIRVSSRLSSPFLSFARDVGALMMRYALGLV